MKKLLWTMLTAVLWTAGAGAADLTAVRTAAAPKIDGRLDDAAWAKAPAAGTFYQNKGGAPATVRTEARFMFDNNAIYVGIKAWMPAGSKYVLYPKNLYAGECVEVMLDPGATRNVYFHFITNPDGVKFDEFRDQGGFVGDPKWDAIWDVAASKGDGFWSAEMRIPFASLDFPAGASRTWTVNVARGARGLLPGAAMEDSALAADGAYHIAGKFPTLGGFDRSFEKYAGWMLGKPVVETAQAGDKIALTGTIAVTNGSGAGRKAVVAFDFIAPDGRTATRKTVNAAFVANGTEQLKFDGFTFDRPGSYQAEVALRDSATKMILKRKAFTVPVAFQALAIRLRDPHYKNAIFATMKLDKVRYSLKIALSAAEIAGKQLTSGVRDAAGKVLCEQTVPATALSNFEFPAAPLPEAKMTIFAQLKDADGKVAAETDHPLRKLPYLAGEVWLTKDRAVMRDGQRFFPIMQWTANDDFLDGVNVFLDWKPYRDTLFLSPIFSHDRTMSQLRKGTAIPAEAEAKIRKLVAAEMVKKGIFAYYLSDEPEVFGDTVEALNRMYEILSDVDPYHPVVLSNNTISGISDYAAAADINGAHSYPKPTRTGTFNNFEKITNFCDAFNARFADRLPTQALAWLAQGFDYSNFAAVNTRIPQYIELRNEYLLSLIAGGNCVIFYNSLNAHYPEIGVGLAEHTKELAAYAPALCAPEEPRALQFTAPGIRATARKVGNEWWFFIANASDKNLGTVEFTVPGLAGRALTVMTEARRITPDGDRFRDRFAPWDVHVYTTDAAAPKLRSRAEIEDEIDRINAARRKPGNLAFQMFEGETVQVTASSNRALNVRADNCLWHVADGVIEPADFKRYNDQQVVWSDTSRNAGPDWIAMSFKKPVTIGRVTIYPVENSLKDYQIQLWKNAAWQTVAEVKDASGAVQDHRFAATASDRVRVFITATRGPHARISEIEVYEK